MLYILYPQNLEWPEHPLVLQNNIVTQGDKMII